MSIEYSAAFVNVMQGLAPCVHAAWARVLKGGTISDNRCRIDKQIVKKFYQFY